MDHVKLQWPAVDCPLDLHGTADIFSLQRQVKMMRCDICISFIDRNCLSRRVIDHKLTSKKLSYFNFVAIIIK